MRGSGWACCVAVLAAGCTLASCVQDASVQVSAAHLEGLRGATRSLLMGHARHFKQGDHIKLYANKVGPFANTHETYQYYTEPFCAPPLGKEYKAEGLGEVLEGDRLVNTPFDIKFRVDKEGEVLCSKELTAKELQRFRKAVQRDFYFQMFLDDLPIWGFVGKVEKILHAGEVTHYKQYLFTHIHFDIRYNGDRVIEVNVSTDPKKTRDISDDTAQIVDFTYSVKWEETQIPPEKRMEKYSKYSFLPQHLEIHWFSIINSCVTVLLLTGFLATILMRVLKNDFLKYSRDEEADDAEETGWKLLHGDVFRFPQHSNLFAAMVGSGTQILVMTLLIFALALAGTFYPYSRGALLSSIIVLYAVTAGVAGYVSGAQYKMFGGGAWVRNVLFTATLFCGPLLLTFSFLNTVAIAYRSTAALPFGTICIIFVIWALVTFPLTVLGGITGKNTRMEFNPPTRTTKYPREVPALPWYRGTGPQMIMAGFLPFSAIYIELFYVFSSVWGHKVYTIYSILFIVFVILVIVTAFITVALTYFQLAVEDHRWWWRSFLCGGSTGLFVYFYCVYFYFQRSDMNGMLQTCFFFGYMGICCFGLFLMLGTVGWRASLAFVRHIMTAAKAD